MDNIVHVALRVLYYPWFEKPKINNVIPTWQAVPASIFWIACSLRSKTGRWGKPGNEATYHGNFSSYTWKENSGRTSGYYAMQSTRSFRKSATTWHQNTRGLNRTYSSLKRISSVPPCPIAGVSSQSAPHTLRSLAKHEQSQKWTTSWPRCYAWLSDHQYKLFLQGCLKFSLGAGCMTEEKMLPAAVEEIKQIWSHCLN